jgi:hypothetical protein
MTKARQAADLTKQIRAMFNEVAARRRITDFHSNIVAGGQKTPVVKVAKTTFGEGTFPGIVQVACVLVGMKKSGHDGKERVAVQKPPIQLGKTATIQALANCE